MFIPPKPKTCNRPAFFTASVDTIIADNERYHSRPHKKFTAAAMKKGIWPPPVYVCTMSDGSERRNSVWQEQGKPFDFDRFRASMEIVDHGETPRTVIAGHVEIGGKKIPDPVFEPAPVVAPKKERATAKTALRDLILWLEGETDDADSILRAKDLLGMAV